jgi:hypothetical protein
MQDGTIIGRIRRFWWAKAHPTICWIPAFAGMTIGGPHIEDHFGDITEMVETDEGGASPALQ